MLCMWLKVFLVRVRFNECGQTRSAPSVHFIVECALSDWLTIASYLVNRSRCPQLVLDRKIDFL